MFSCEFCEISKNTEHLFLRNTSDGPREKLALVLTVMQIHSNISEEYSELCQTSKMERFAKIISSV